MGIWACGKADVEPGSRVFITGGGPIGALTALAARSYGATDVLVSDLVESRRERILDFGATRSVDPREDDFDPSTLEADAFVECSGALPAMLQAWTACAAAARPSWSAWATSRWRCPCS